MAEKFNLEEELSPKELAKHLRQPEGETGKEVGLQMNKGNKHICLNSYKLLAPKAKDTILEIGMGNGFFVKDLLQMAESMHYTGVDFSPTMVAEAEQINQEQISNGTVQFKCASIEKLPFDNDSFDCITTTNTLYFWPDPENNIKELSRVLKPSGKLLIAYRSRSCMDQLELAKYGFEKYNPEEVEKLLLNSGFTAVSTEMINEPDLEFDGKTLRMDGIFTVGLKK